jgi:hypothetical protein
MSWKVPVRPDAVAAIRAQVSKTLADWGVTDEDGDNILIASELITNAVRHGEGDITLLLVSIDEHVMGWVTDRGGAVPCLRPVEEIPSCGWGLHLVADLAADWGIARPGDGPGKSVWWRWEMTPRQA